MSRVQVKLGRELGRGSEGRVFEIVGTNQVCKVLNMPYQEGVLPSELIVHDGVFQRMIQKKVEPFVLEPHACLVYMNGQPYYGLVLNRLYPISYPLDADCFVKDLSTCLLHYLRWAIPLLTGLQQSEVVHGDIKPSNIMKDGKSNRTLVDFGVAQTYAAFQRSTTEIGTLSICAPEYLAGSRQYPFQADVWAMGKFLIGLLGLSDVFTFLQEKTPDSAGVLSVIPQKIACFESLDEGLDQGEIAAALQVEKEKLKSGMGFFPMFFQIVGQMLSIHPAVRPDIAYLKWAYALLESENLSLPTGRMVADYFYPSGFQDHWINYLRAQYGVDSSRTGLPFENLFHAVNFAAAASAQQEAMPVAARPVSPVGNGSRFAFAGQGQIREVEIEYLTIQPLQASAASSTP